jgi:kumamolisin
MSRNASVVFVSLLIVLTAYSAAFISLQSQSVQVRSEIASDIIALPHGVQYLSPMKSGNIEFIVGLMPSNQTLLYRTLAALYNPYSPYYHRWLSPEQFIAEFAPSSSLVSSVESYMGSKGAQLVHVSLNRMLLTFDASPQVVGNIFGIQLYQFRFEGHTYYYSSGSPTLPYAIASQVAGVEGLQNFTIETHPAVYQMNLRPDYVPPTGPDPTPPYNPVTIFQAYNFTGVYSKDINGYGISISIVTAYGFNNATVQTFDSDFGITASRIVVEQPDGSVNEIGLETTLDTEWMSAVVPNATIYVVEGPNPQLSTFTSLFSYVVDHNLSSVISTSWGTPESETPSSVLSNDNNIFKQAAAEGISITAASGDNGALDNTSSPTPDFPASSPYVTGVGGTWLNLSSSNGHIVRVDETGWNRSGGGVSSYFPEPAYQRIPNAFNLGGRGVPDVAFSAEPDAGYFVLFNGTWLEAGGTSFGAPIWAGILALENQIRAQHGEADIGLANLELYHIANSTYYTQAFYEITQGYNGYYYAQPGYNMVTGLGTPNVYNLLMLLAKIPIKPLKVDVTATPPWGDAPLDVSLFANISGGFPPYTVNWYMNGKEVGNSANIVENGLSPGNYAFKVVVTDNVSVTVTGYSNVTVFSFSSPNNMTLSASPNTGDANLTVYFSDTPYSTPLLSEYFVMWAFGDAPGINSTSFSETHVYTAGGNFTVVSTAFVTDSSAPRGYYTMQAETHVTVYPRLQAEMLGNRFGGSYPLHLRLEGWQSGGDAPYNYTWIYSNQSGNYSSNSQLIYLNYTKIGKYTVTLTVRDRFGETSTVSRLIEVYTPISVSISVSPSTDGVAPFNVTFRANATGGAGGFIYRWYIGNTVITGNPVYYIFTNGGNNTVMLKVTDIAGDVAYSNVTIHVEPLGFLSLLKGETALVVLAFAIAVAAIISYVISRRK